MENRQGHGGSYRIEETGEVTLIERTREGPPDPPQPANPAIEKPASAGFFTPVVPAIVAPVTPGDPSTTIKE